MICNLPFLFFGYKHIGRNFFISSSFAIALLAIVEFPLKTIGPFVTDPLLALFSVDYYWVQVLE
ncbi:hypothetical protein HMPREF9372_0537 [Sporosarcina newyorkensis 2681]|uniref:Uncharacterized protein n=1 Tax=Sporosarcina newyorkensis 2681 TaxID=1027292 RepID=F9DP07_9BACL|nr:hypothetical protein HMPREF9372_0537 [Sporosarcina newyorkensis 2681]